MRLTARARREIFRAAFFQCMAPLPAALAKTDAALEREALASPFSCDWMAA